MIPLERLSGFFFFSIKFIGKVSPVFSSAEEGSWSSSGLLWLFVIHCALISLVELLATSVCDPVADDEYCLVE